MHLQLVTNLNKNQSVILDYLNSRIKIKRGKTYKVSNNTEIAEIQIKWLIKHVFLLKGISEDINCFHGK